MLHYFLQNGAVLAVRERYSPILSCSFLARWLLDPYHWSLWQLQKTKEGGSTWLTPSSNAGHTADTSIDTLFVTLRALRLRRCLAGGTRLHADGTSCC